MSLLAKISPQEITKRPIFNTPYLNVSGSTPPDRTTEGFLRAYGDIGWLHAVVFRIALGCSEVEWTLFDSTNQEKPKQVFKHPVLDLLHLVNPLQTSNEFIALDTIYQELIGESFWALNLNALGEPAQIILPYPHRMSVVPAKEFPFVRGYVYGTGADAVPFDVNEIIHFKYPNPLNQYHGLAPARAIGINLDAEQNADKWVNQFFYNSARPDGVIQFDYNLSDEQFDKLKKQWSEKYKGISKAHQVALLEGGGKYLQIQNTIKDMDFANLKQKNRDVILGVFGMPQSVMGISENVNKANAIAGDYTFARWIVKPRLEWKKAKLQEQLLPKFRRSENLELGFEEVVPATIEEKRDLAESGMRAGYLTINEARKLQRLDPLPNGDVLLVPLNLIATPISGKVTQTVTETPKSKGGEGSGNFGHEGRPGEVGGSGPGGGGGGDKPSGGDSGGGGAVDVWLSGKNDLKYDSAQPIKSDEYKPTKGEGKWAEGLSESETAGIHSWQSGGTNEIRNFDRTGQGDKWTQDTVKNFDSALNKAEPYKGEVYRGLHDLNDESYQKVISSKEIKLDSHASATISQDRAAFFVQPIRDTPTKSVLFKIDNKTGVNISAASKETFKNEVEVVLRKGTQYKVSSIKSTKFTYRDRSSGTDKTVEGAIIHLSEK